MFRKFVFSVLCLCLSCFNVFAAECSGDEKLVFLNDTKIGSSFYDTKVYAHELKKGDNISGSLYSDGDFFVKNYKSDNLYAKGISMCLDTVDSDELLQDLHYGSYCWCKITELDTYKVFGDWGYMTQYIDNSFDESRFENNTLKAEEEKKRVDKLNLENCMTNCPKYCQNNLSKLIKNIQGYYVCDTAVHKTNNKNCVFKKDILGVKEIKVFDDVAEIIISNQSVPLKKDETYENGLLYVGKYGYDKIYLKIESDARGTKYLVGKDIYSLKECL